jgi:hypothetical protein
MGRAGYSAIKWPVLPFGHAVHDRIGDGGDGLLGDLGAVHLGQVSGDLPMGQALGRQRQDHLIHPRQPALPLAHQLRLEGAGHITRHPHLDRADVGHHGLGTAAVTTVAAVLADRVVLVVAEVIGDLTFQGRLQHPLGQLLQQPSLTGQLQTLASGPIYQHRDQLLIRNRAVGLNGRFVHGQRLHSGLGHQACLP